MRQLSSLFQAPLSGDFEGLSVEGAGRFLSGRLLPLVRVLCRGPSLLRASPPSSERLHLPSAKLGGGAAPGLARRGSGWRCGDGERQKRRGVAGLSAFARCGQAARPTHRPKRGGRSPEPLSPAPRVPSEPVRALTCPSRGRRPTPKAPLTSVTSRKTRFPKRSLRLGPQQFHA